MRMKIFDWKEKLHKQTDRSLFDLFSECERINIDPQLYAGNLLYERNYDLDSLVRAKSDLIVAIKESFSNKYDLDPGKIARKAIGREVFLMICAFVFVMENYYLSEDFQYEMLGVVIDNKAIACGLGLFIFVPFLWSKTTIRKAIAKVQKEQEKNEKLIQKINSELKF